MTRIALTFLLIVMPASAASAGLTERQLAAVGLAPPAGVLLPLNTQFTDAQSGAAVTLRQALQGKPSVLVLVDYRCRFICGSTLSIAAAALSESSLTPGSDFQLAVIGIDARDSPNDALAMKKAKLGSYPALYANAAFLSGDAASIGRVTGALNYRAVYDAAIDQFAHPTAALVLTPEGRLSQVISGLAMDGASFRDALRHAQEGETQGVLTGIRLLCYSLAALHGPYTFAIRLVLMAAGVATLAAIAAFAGFLTRRAKGTRPS